MAERGKRQLAIREEIRQLLSATWEAGLRQSPLLARWGVVLTAALLFILS